MTKITILKHYRNKETLKPLGLEEIVRSIQLCEYQQEVENLQYLLLTTRLTRLEDGSAHGADNYTSKIPRVCFASEMENRNRQRIHKAYNRTREFNFSLNGLTGFDFHGKTVGVIGTGKIGRIFIDICRGFGMNVIAYDAYCPDEAMIAAAVEPVHSAQELYQRADIVSLHIPATAETKGSINKALVGLMPKGGILVNTARKEVINEAELIELMQERQDIKYVTDIMPAQDATMRELCAGRYFATPKKMGAQTAEANINAGIAAAKQIVDFFTTGNTRFQVNR